MDGLLKRYSWLVTLVGIGLCAVFLGRAAASVLVAVALSGDGPPLPRREFAGIPSGPAERAKDIEAILKRNIFCSTCAPIVITEEKVEEGPVDTRPQRSNLNLALLATLVNPDMPLASLAVVRDTADDKKTVRIYRRGDYVLQNGQEVGRMAQVVEGRAYLLVGRRIEYIDQGNGPPPPPPPSVASAAEPSPGEATGLEKDIDRGVRCSGSNCEVDKSLIDKILANTTALATSARFVPSIKDGKPNGFKLYAIRPGSVFAKIGLQNADLIKQINGLDMSTPDKALEAYTKLKSASHLTVVVERRNENLTLDYQIR